MGNEVSTESGVKPKPGDLIEIFRGGYQHWAVYIGDGYVVHLAPPSENPGAGSYSMMSMACNRALVSQAGLYEVVGDDEWRINNILDDQYEPRPAYQVVREARRLVGSVLPYSILQSNCEHFVTELRYGKAQSRQVRQAVETAVISIGGAMILGAVVAAMLESGEEKRRTRRY